MKSVLAVVGVASLIGVAVAALPAAERPSAAVAKQVVVRCPSGGNAASVTPTSIKLAVGDTLVWRMTGTVISDSISITLKDADKAWPFSGARPRGTTTARTGRATVKGTYAYNVHLLCRMPGGGTQPVLIDPDVIIE